MKATLFNLFLIAGLIHSFEMNAQVSISYPVTSPASSAMLDVKSDNKGVLLPRIALLSATDVSTIPSPATSLMIYNTATAGSGADAVSPGYYYWNGSNWARMSAYPTAVYGTNDNNPLLITSVSGCTGNGPTLLSTNAPITIPDNIPAGITDTINFTGYTGYVCNAQVDIRIDHPYDGDLDIYLIAPDGTSVELSTDNGTTGDNYGTGTDLSTYVFTSFASNSIYPSITTGAAPFAGFYQPEGSFTALNGKPVNGKWVLKVIDDANGDVGTLLRWKLTLYTQPNVNYVLEKEVPVTIQPGMNYLASADYTAACRNPEGIETHLAWSTTSAGPLGTESATPPANILYSSAMAPVTTASERFVHLHNQGILSTATPGSTVYFQLWRRDEVFSGKVNASLIVQAIQQ